MLGNFNGWHLLFPLVIVLVVGLWVTAVVSISRAMHLSGTARAVWFLAVDLAPVLGAIAWFLGGRRTRPRDKP